MIDQHRIALRTGVTLDVWTAGNRTAPPIVLLHGFPESHRTWRHQIAALAETRFVIAPNQRGYARSSKPRGVAAYAPDKIIGDLIALADHFALARFTLAGHDWGGAIAWMAALGHRERIARLIIINAPHPLIFQKSLFDDPAQRVASRYITRLRETAIDRGLTGARLERLLGTNLLQHLVGAIAGADKAAYLDEWAQPGAITAMLNWYRASPVVVPAPGAEPPRPAFLDAPFPRISQPTLVIWGMRDKALLPCQLDGLDALVPDLSIVRIDAGHFVTWQAPAEVTAALRAWLEARDA